MVLLNGQEIVLVLIGIKLNMRYKLIKRNTLAFLSFVFLLFHLSSFGNIKDRGEQKKNILFYEIITDSDISENKILKLEIFENTTYSIIGQTPISYDYCKTITECEKIVEKLKNGKITVVHNEITGLKRESDLVWIHPPRFDNFRVLELNAFPYYKKYSLSWEKSITFRNDWGNEKWITWEGLRRSTSTYTALEIPVVYLLGNEKIDCVEINASTTIPDLGKTSSVFYYNEKYGFVRMVFVTINNKKIEFRLIKVSNDTNTN